MQVLAAVGKKITEKINVISLFLTVVLSGIAYGWIEGTLYPYYPLKNELQVFGHFTYYHLVFCFMFLVIGFTFSLTKVVAMWSLRKGYLFAASAGSLLWGFWIEDMSYYSIVQGEVLGPDSWVNWVLGGKSIFGHWIPTVYFLLSFTGFCLFGAAYIRSSKDALAMMKFTKAGLSKGEAKLQKANIPTTLKLSKDSVEFLRYSLSAGSAALLVQLFTVVAASITTSDVHPGTLRVVLTGLTILVPTLIILPTSNAIYNKISGDSS